MQFRLVKETYGVSQTFGCSTRVFTLEDSAGNEHQVHEPLSSGWGIDLPPYEIKSPQGSQTFPTLPEAYKQAINFGGV